MNIIEAIKKETGIDVTAKCRKRPNVEMKALASFILKRKGLSLQSIGRELNLNHATIIHHLKNYESIKKYNKEVQHLEDLFIDTTEEVLESSYNSELNKIISQKSEEILNLRLILNRYDKDIIKRVVALLENEQFEIKLEAFVNINEKAKYYPKFN